MGEADFLTEWSEARGAGRGGQGEDGGWRMEDLAVRCNVPDINWHITLDGHRHVLTRLPGLGWNPSRRFVFLDG